MTNHWIAKCGAAMGQADDERKIHPGDTAGDPDSLIRYALQQFADSWPESDSDYDAVVWVETEDGDAIAREYVSVSRDGIAEVAS